MAGKPSTLRHGGLGELRSLMIYALALLAASLMFSGTPSRASAASWLNGTQGWRWTAFQSGHEADPATACAKVLDSMFSELTNYQNLGLSEGDTANEKRCNYHTDKNDLTAYTYVNLDCDKGSVQALPGACVTELFPQGCPTTQHPIDILSGAKLFVGEDFRAANDTLLLIRLFNSSPYRNTQIGLRRLPQAGFANWSLSIAYELQIPSTWNDLVNVLTPEGDALTFQRQSDGSMRAYTPTSSGDPSLPARPLPQSKYSLSFVGAWPSPLSSVTSASTTWNLTGPDDTVYTIVTQPDNTGVFTLGSTTKAKTREGSSQTLTYGTDHFISKKVDEEGRETRYNNYDGKGRPRQVIEADGTSNARTFNFTWHSALNVPTIVELPNLVRRNYTYTNGQLTQLTLTDLTSFTDPYPTNGRTRTWTYGWSATGQLTSIDGPLAGVGDTTTYGYNPDGTLHTVTDPLGHVTTVAAVDWRGAPATVVDANGVTTTFAYDVHGRPLTATVNPAQTSRFISSSTTPSATSPR